MESLDQSARNAVIAAGMKEGLAMDHVMTVDASHLRTIKKIFANNHFPDIAEVGENGQASAFVLVQHADDTAFQASLLPRLKSLYDQGEISGDDLALLTDRVLRGQHEPQRYGTQYSFTTNNAAMTMDHVEDPARLDALRASLSMMPEKDYQCELSSMYGVPANSP